MYYCADANWDGENVHHAEQREPALVRHTAVQREDSEDMGTAQEDIHVEGPADSCIEAVHAVLEVLEVGHGHHRALVERLHPWSSVVRFGQDVHRVDQQ
jgi:hypothetical protein